MFPGKRFRWWAVFLAGALPPLLFLLAPVLYFEGPSMVNDQPLPPFPQIREVSQSFTSLRKPVRIDLLLSANHRVLQGTVCLEVYDGVSHGLLGTTCLPAREVVDNRYLAFPLSLSREAPLRRYLFSLYFQGAEPWEQLVLWSDARGNTYPFGDMWVEGVMWGGDAAFRVYSRRPLLLSLSLLTKRFALFRLHGWLLWVLLLPVLLLPALVLYSLFQNERKNQELR